MSQSVYKVMGKNGRIYLPRELQNEMEIQRGDIIKLIPVKDGVQIKKVHLIEMGDKSPEANPRKLWRLLSTLPHPL